MVLIFAGVHPQRSDPFRPSAYNEMSLKFLQKGSRRYARLCNIRLYSRVIIHDPCCVILGRALAALD